MDEAPHAVTNKWIVTISVSFGTLMGAVDSSIVNVALPHMQGALGASVQEITWVSTGYAVALVLLMPMTAFLGRRFGQKRMYLSCLALFLVGSSLCGTATTLPQLIGYRALQGLGAGALQPTEQAILRQTFPHEEQGMAMAVFGMVVMIGPAIGPTLGGYIVDQLHWSWIFFINIPVGAMGMAMVATFVHEDPRILEKNKALAERERHNVDWIGIALLSVGLSVLEYFLEEGQRNDWFGSATITVCFLVSVSALLLFVARELTAPAPVVNLRMFRDSVFASGTLIGGLMFALLIANIFLLPLFMQDLLGFTATQSGWALMPRALVMMVVTPFVGKIYNYVSPALMVGFGVLAFMVGSYELSQLTLQSGAMDVIVGVMVQGLGFGFLFVPLTTVALSTIPRHRMADATSMNSLVRQVGGAIGLAIFATILERDTDGARDALAGELPRSSLMLYRTLAGLPRALGAAGVKGRSEALLSLNGVVETQASVIAFEHVFMLAGLVFLIVLPLLFLLKTDRSSPSSAADRAEALL